jgi:uncharacterized membrane protein
MDDARVPRIIYCLMLTVGVLSWVRSYPLLPERMASHFRFDGMPNGWMPRDAFFLVMSLVLGLTIIIAFLVPRLIAVLPDNQINLPHKAYWLAPARRAETFQFFATQMAWFGCAILLVLLFGTSLAIKANLSPDGRFDNGAMIKVMAVFLLLMVLWTVHFLRHFYRLPADAVSSH